VTSRSKTGAVGSSAWRETKGGRKGADFIGGRPGEGLEAGNRCWHHVAGAGGG
jgi:hypothetical protein